MIEIVKGHWIARQIYLRGISLICARHSVSMHECQLVWGKTTQNCHSENASCIFIILVGALDKTPAVYVTNIRSLFGTQQIKATYFLTKRKRDSCGNLNIQGDALSVWIGALLSLVDRGQLENALLFLLAFSGQHHQPRATFLLLHVHNVGQPAVGVKSQGV